jgi:hypothetical protein
LRERGERDIQRDLERGEREGREILREREERDN